VVRRSIVPTERRSLTPTIIDDYMERELRNMVDENGQPMTIGIPQYRRRMEGMPYPDSLPAFGGGIVDTEGWVWLRPYQSPSDSIAPWSVFTPDFEEAVTVPLPQRFRPFEIGNDYIAGVSVDGLGVETVKVLNLVRGVPSLEE